MPFDRGRSAARLVVLSAGLAVAGCSNSPSGSGPSGAGGSLTATGGAASVAGASSGGDANAGGVSTIGGQPGGGTGGASVGSGGKTTTGGTASSGGTSASGGATPVGGVANASANVKFTQAMQVIDGFGVSNAWLSAPSNKTAVYDALFSVSKGAGLSMLRSRVPFREKPSNDDKFINKDASGNYTSTTDASGSKTFSLNWSNWDLTNTSTLIADIKAAGADYQVTQFLSTPWTPPNNSVSRWKLSSAGKTIDYVNAPEVGGHLDPNHYADYAAVLADYVLGYRAKMGVDLSALSLQNEPNFQTDYESADWTAEQFHSFFGVLKTTFTQKGVFTKLPNLLILAPEFQNVKEDLLLPTLADSNTAPVLGLVGVHQYEFGTANASTYSPPLLSKSLAAGKRVWMTEWSSAAWATSSAMADGILLARLVHMDLALGSMSAFFYWWSWGDGNGYLVLVNGSTVTVPKRLYALGQFSRFVRPGWYRVATTPNPSSNVYLSAFRDAAGTQVAVVAINAGTSAATLPLSIDTGKFGNLTQYRTSASENLANVGTLASAATLSVTLPGSSVTTLVGPVTR